MSNRPQCREMRRQTLVWLQSRVSECKGECRSLMKEISGVGVAGISQGELDDGVEGKLERLEREVRVISMRLAYEKRFIR